MAKPWLARSSLALGPFFLALVALVVLCSIAVAAPVPPWRDHGRPLDVRVRDLVARLTLEEKTSLLGVDSPAIPRLGLGKFGWWNECVHGVVAEGATIFPQAVALAATWDPELALAVATAISDEARALHRLGRVGLTFWSPVMNLARDPRWGRVQESYGEDPWLAARIGVAFVRGLQGDDPKHLKVVATPKHFAANSEENRRFGGSATVSERTLRAFYLPHFAACVREAGAASVMCAYNAVNGVPCCANRTLLDTILRKEWKFDGYVVSDCGAIDQIATSHRTARTAEEAAVMALRAGCDLDCGGTYQAVLAGAVRRGRVAAAAVDRAVSRLLRARFRLGEFDPPERVRWAATATTVVDSAPHRALAFRTARQSFVLLRNPRGLLPFPSGLASLAVIGPSAAVTRFGNYSGWFTPAVTPLDGLRARAAGARVAFARGCEIVRRPPIPPAAFGPGLRAEVFASPEPQGAPVLVRTDPQIAFAWGEGAPAPGIPDKGFAVRWSGTLTCPAGGVRRLVVTADDGVRLTVDGRRLIDKWEARPVNTETATVWLDAGRPVPLILEYSHQRHASAIALGWDLEPDHALLREAVAAARAADACVVVVGTDRETENEGRDRPDLDLPGDQNLLVASVVEANPRTVVVIVAGSAVAMPWLGERSPAVLQAWFPGEEGGNALAQVLFGDEEPGGRLPLTFPRSAEDLPPLDDYEPARGRTYRYATAPPLYPFGFGLGYTAFRYERLRLDRERLAPGGTLRALVRVANTGARAGETVVQAYVAGPPGTGPARLRAFRRARVEPGGAAEVALEIRHADLASVGPDLRETVTPGPYALRAGPDSSTGLLASFQVD